MNIKELKCALYVKYIFICSKIKSEKNICTALFRPAYIFVC